MWKTTKYPYLSNNKLTFVGFNITKTPLRRVWRYQRGIQNPYIEEEQTTQRPKEKVQKDKQRSTKEKVEKNRQHNDQKKK